MIFNQLNPNTDIVAGRTNRIDSGFWPNGNAFTSQSGIGAFTDNFYALTQSAVTPSPSYGASIYDIRRTMYYVDVFPDSTTLSNNNPYFSVAYGNYDCEASGSGTFNLDTASILAFAPKAIYTQYQNLLLGEGESGLFQFTSGSAANPSLITPRDIFIINFSSYNMKDMIDAGVFEITLSGSLGSITLRDDSPFLTQASSVYNLIQGSINDATTTLPPYQGIGLLYPDDGVVIFNAPVVDSLIGLSAYVSVGVSGSIAPNGYVCPANYSTGSLIGIAIPGQPSGSLVPTTWNHAVFSWAIQNANATMKVRKSEFVPSLNYFVRVMNKDFNFSNNPTYIYDGNTASPNGVVYPAGTIYNQDFISNPTTYITTIGLYNDGNELVAVAKLSRPALKTFDNELLIKVRLDF